MPRARELEGRRRRGEIEYTDMARILNAEFFGGEERITAESVRCRLRRERFANGESGGSTDVVYKEREPDDYQRLLSENARLSKRLQNREADAKNVVRACLARVDRMKFYPLKGKQLPLRVDARQEQEFHGMLSDIHYGEEVLTKETMGIGAYNKEICLRRMNKWQEKIVKFQEQDRLYHGLNELVLFVVGDIAAGNFYPKQPWELDMNEIEQIFFAIEDLGSRLRELRTHFTHISVYWVPGNHRWNSKKDQAHWTWLPDFLIGRSLQMLLRNIEGIEFYISNSPKMVVQRGKKLFCLGHGQDARSFVGIPYYGIDRVYRRLANLTKVLIDYYLIGHFHEAANLSGGAIFINGCVPGGSQLSINRMNVTSLPSQKIWMFHPREGVNRESNLWLDKAPELEADERGILTPYNDFGDQKELPVADCDTRGVDRPRR